MLLLIDTFSINKGRGYENPSLEIIVTEHCSTGGFPLEEACEHCHMNQSVVYVAISYIISVYCEDYAGYFTVILSFLAFHFCSSYFIYLVSCRSTNFLFFLATTGRNLQPPSFSGYNLREAPTPQFSGYNQKEATTPYVLRIQPEGGYNHLSLPHLSTLKLK
jgi:hypothetical protein